MKKSLFIITLLLVTFNLISQATDAAGKKQGYWKKTEEKTGKLIYEGMFKDDKPQGVFKYYYPFDSVKAIIDFKQDGKFAYAKLFHPTGKIMARGKYTGESIKDSVWLFYDEMGVLMSKEKYVNGKKEGKAFVYYANGKIAEEKNYKMDLQHGAVKQYYDGTKVKSEATFVNGLQEGKSVFYYPNGVAAASGFFKNGFKNGAWIYKEQDGKISEKELYENGKLADKKKTDEFFSKNKVKGTTPEKSGKDKPKENKPATKKG